MRLTLKKVNAELKKLGAVDELVKGEGYYYFIGETSHNWRQASVYVMRLNDLSLEHWIDEWKYLSKKEL